MKQIAQRRISVKQIRPPQSPLRANPEITEEFLQSVKSGLLEPIIVRETSERQSEQKYEVVVGHADFSPSKRQAEIGDLPGLRDG